MHTRRYWALAIVLAVIEIDARNMDAYDREYWHLAYQEAIA